jgi:hypothetical protein
VAGPPLQYFSYYLIHSIFEKKLLTIKYVVTFSTTETFFSLERIEQDTIKNVYRSSGTVRVILVRAQHFNAGIKSLRVTAACRGFLPGILTFNAYS